MPRYLWAARNALIDALVNDLNLEKFDVPLPDGHKLTLGELHTWLSTASEHYEKNGAREAALRTLQEKLQTQSPAHQ